MHYERPLHEWLVELLKDVNHANLQLWVASIRFLFNEVLKEMLDAVGCTLHGEYITACRELS